MDVFLDGCWMDAPTRGVRRCPVEPMPNWAPPASGSMKTIRGGCWGNEPSDIRTTNRLGMEETGYIIGLGFRCALGP